VEASAEGFSGEAGFTVIVARKAPYLKDRVAS